VAVIALVYGATPDGDDRAEEEEANVIVPSALDFARGRCQDRLGEDTRDVKLR